jgi:hypothetical protein
MPKSKRPLVYFAVITLTEKGKRPVQNLSEYEVLRRDGTLIKEGGPIRDDPDGFYAHGEVTAAAMNDAEALEEELDEKNIVAHYIRTREDAQGRPY